MESRIYVSEEEKTDGEIVWRSRGKKGDKQKTTEKGDLGESVGLEREKKSGRLKGKQ